MPESTSGAATGASFAITRNFDAPRNLVWNAFTSAEHLGHWWGPQGSSIEIKSFDLRPGGMFHYSMRFPNRPAMWGRFIYREIVEPERLVFINSFSDEAGGLGSNPWFTASWPKEILTTVVFAEHGGKTEITLTATPINATEDECTMFVNMFDSMRGGFGGTFDQLAEYLAGSGK